MFKKLKDKLEEEFKQNPLRLPTSVQQLAQAISPSPSVHSLSENSNNNSAQLPDTISVSSDFFSIGDDTDSFKTLHNVDLSAASPSNLTSARSRRSSLSSIASDVSSLFPIYENPLNHTVLQSDLESEVEDGVSVQLEKISKEKLYQGYRKLLYRYNKYKGRFVDLSRIHKDLQSEHIKIKHVLQESQDKSLRRLAELREQCILEQKAKAHLEETLRSDLEEKDHVIDTLNTKISLLKGNDSSETSEESLKLRIAELEAEIKKFKRFSDSSSNADVKEKIDELKSGIVQMKTDNENLTNLLLANKSPSISDGGSDSGAMMDFSEPILDERDKKIEKLNNLLLKCKEKINGLTTDLRSKQANVQELLVKIEKLDKEVVNGKDVIEGLESEVAVLRKREEENVLTIAENKMVIHKELEAKEELIKSLTKDLESAQEENKLLKLENSEKFALFENQLKELESKQNVVDDTSVTIKVLADLESEMNKFFTNHQNSLAQVVKRVEDKFIHAQNNISKIATDFVVKSENSLHNKTLDLNNETREKEEWKSKAEKLLTTIDRLNEDLVEKQKIISTREGTIKKLTLEVNEKIDRLVECGNEMENLKITQENEIKDLQSKLDQNIRLKCDWENKLKMLEKSYESLQIQFNNLNQQLVEAEMFKQNLMRDTTELKHSNDKVIIDLQMKIDLLEKTVEEKKKQIEELQDSVPEKSKIIEVLTKANEEYKSEISCLKDEIEELKIVNKLTDDLERKIIDMHEVIDEKEKTINELLTSEVPDKVNRIMELEKLLEDNENKTSLIKNELESCKSKNENIKALNLEIKNLTDMLEKSQELINELQNSKIPAKDNEIASLKDTIQLHENKINCLTNTIDTLKQENSETGDLKTEQENLRKVLKEKDKLILELENVALPEKLQEIEYLKKIIEQHESEINRLVNEFECFKKNVTNENVKIKEDNESKLNILKLEIKFLNEKYENDLKSFENNRQIESDKNENTCRELISKLEIVSQERDELKAACEERGLKVAELSGCIENLKRNLDANFDGDSKLKSVTDEYELKMLKKDEQIRDLEVKMSENKEALNNLQTLKSANKKLISELKEKDNLLETKIEELEGLKKAKENEIINNKIDTEDILQREKQKFEEKLSEHVLAHKTELESSLEKQRVQYETKISNIEKENNSQREGLLKEKKNIVSESGSSLEDFESTSKIAVAAMESTNETIELLRREIIQRTNEMTDIKRQHKREMLEMQKVFALRGRSPSQTDPDMEHEYLRNILYEYMMGREQLVLAKVLAAIVKFDKQQTHNVLERQSQVMNQIRIL